MQGPWFPSSIIVRNRAKSLPSGTHTSRHTANPDRQTAGSGQEKAISTSCRPWLSSGNVAAGRLRTALSRASPGLPQTESSGDISGKRWVRPLLLFSIYWPLVSVFSPLPKPCAIPPSARTAASGLRGPGLQRLQAHQRQRGRKRLCTALPRAARQPSLRRGVLRAAKPPGFSYHRCSCRSRTLWRPGMQAPGMQAPVRSDVALLGAWHGWSFVTVSGFRGLGFTRSLIFFDGPSPP